MTTPIGVESWSTLQAVGVERPTGGGTFAFAILQDDVGDGYFEGGIREQIDLGTGCGDADHASASVALASDLEAVGVPFLQRARVLVVMEINSFPYPSTRRHPAAARTQQNLKRPGIDDCSSP